MMSHPVPQPPRAKWHSAPWWVGIGGICAVLAVVIAMVAWWFPRQSNDAAVAPTNPPTATNGGFSGILTSSTPPATSTLSEDPTATADPTTAQPATLDPNPDPLYVSEIPRDDFVRNYYLPQRSTATIGGREYPSSYWFEFFNCGSCTDTAEFNIHPVYSRFVGVVGLTDDSRRDDVIDGIQSFSIYVNNKLVFGPKRVEFPGSATFDVDVSNASRIKLVVSDGTNDEYACWCGARFIK